MNIKQEAKPTNEFSNHQPISKQIKNPIAMSPNNPLRSIPKIAHIEQKNISIRLPIKTAPITLSSVRVNNLTAKKFVNPISLNNRSTSSLNKKPQKEIRSQTENLLKSKTKANIGLAETSNTKIVLVKPKRAISSVKTSNKIQPMDKKLISSKTVSQNKVENKGNHKKNIGINLTFLLTVFRKIKVKKLAMGFMGLLFYSRFIPNRYTLKKNLKIQVFKKPILCWQSKQLLNTIEGNKIEETEILENSTNFNKRNTILSLLEIKTTANDQIIISKKEKISSENLSFEFLKNPIPDFSQSKATKFFEQKIKGFFNK